MTWVYDDSLEAYHSSFSFTQLAFLGEKLHLSSLKEFKEKSASLYRGRLGEALLCHFFLSRDYLRLCSLFRSIYGEIDQVWQKGREILLLEVRTRYLPTATSRSRSTSTSRSMFASMSKQALDYFMRQQMEAYSLFPSLKKARSLYTGTFFECFADEKDLGCIDRFLTVACFIEIDFSLRQIQACLQFFDWLTEEAVVFTK